SLINPGVSKSGSPAPNETTSTPAFFNALAFAVTAKVIDSAISFKRLASCIAHSKTLTGALEFAIVRHPPQKVKSPRLLKTLQPHGNNRDFLFAVFAFDGIYRGAVHPCRSIHIAARSPPGPPSRIPALANRLQSQAVIARWPPTVNTTFSQAKGGLHD